MKQSKNINSDFKDFLDSSEPNIKGIFGVDYENKSAGTIIAEGINRAEQILEELEPYSKSDTLPEYFSPMAVHAIFARAFLYSSAYYEALAYTVKLKNIRYANGLGFDNAIDFVFYMIENLHYYEHISQYKNGSVHLYSEMSIEFKEHQIASENPDIFDYQLMAVINILDPVEHILNELRFKIENIQNEIRNDFANAVNQLDQISPNTPMDHWPVSLGAPLVGSDMKTTRTPKTFLPHWHEALKIHLLKLNGEKEAGIIRSLFGESQESSGYETRKTRVYLRARLAERLTLAAFRRMPLSWAHTQNL